MTTASLGALPEIVGPDCVILLAPITSMNWGTVAGGPTKIDQSVTCLGGDPGDVEPIRTRVMLLVALVMACIGLYGSVSYAVAQRSREVGIRLSLGAARCDEGADVLAELWGSRLRPVGCVGGDDVERCPVDALERE